MNEYSTKHALLGQIIDYAGTFPPAALELADAIRRAASFRSEGRHPWLFSKVALPLTDLKKISSRFLYEAGATGESWMLTALGSAVEPALSSSDYARQVEWDLRELRRCNERGFYSSYRQWIVAYETKLPASLFQMGLREGQSAVKLILERVVALTNGIVDPFFEIGWDGNWQKNLNFVADALSEWENEQDNETFIPGIKVRTGGKYVPKASELAEVIIACTTRGLRFKATQGLHHAVTRPEGMGFINLFAALSFAQALGEEAFSQNHIEECLQDQDGRAFVFNERELLWRSHRIDVEAIEAARRQHGATFGSCSLDEPDLSLFEFFGEQK